MRQVAKYATPLFVLLGLVIFSENQSQFLWPVLLQIISISIIFLSCKPIREKSSAAALLLFWLAPLALLWLLSERREGRDMNPTSIGIQVAMAGIGTSLILVKESLKKSDIKLILAILLTWAVAYLSGSSGGADRMGSMFDFLGLTVEQLNNLVIVIRKTIHVSFYGSLAWLFATYLWNDYSNRKILYSYSIAFPLSIALADEYRQSMMPNRQGSYSDVILDMSATFFVLGMLHWNERRLIRSNDKIG